MDSHTHYHLLNLPGQGAPKAPNLLITCSSRKQKKNGWKRAAFIDQSNGKRDGADVTDHQPAAWAGKRDVMFFASRARRSNQRRAKERESPSLHLKAERSSSEWLAALELNACWEETDKDKTQQWKPDSERAGRSQLSTIIWAYNKRSCLKMNPTENERLNKCNNVRINCT